MHACRSSYRFQWEKQSIFGHKVDCYICSKVAVQCVDVGYGVIKATSYSIEDIDHGELGGRGRKRKEGWRGGGGGY